MGWLAVRGLPSHEPNRGGAGDRERTATVCGTVVNTNPYEPCLTAIGAQPSEGLTDRRPERSARQALPRFGRLGRYGGLALLASPAALVT